MHRREQIVGELRRDDLRDQLVTQLPAAPVSEHDLLVVCDWQRTARGQQIRLRSGLIRGCAADGSLGDILCP